MKTLSRCVALESGALKLIMRHWLNLHPGAYPAVGTVALTPDASQVYLSLRRGSRLPGLWTGAGGFVEAGEGPLEGALRELQEEAGLVVAGDRLEYLGVYPGKWPGGTYLAMQFALFLQEGEVLQPMEPEKHGPWCPFPLSQAATLPLLEGLDQGIRDVASLLDMGHFTPRTP